MLSNMKVLLVLLVVIAGLAFWVLKDNQEPNENQPLIPEWQGKSDAMAKVNRVVISQAGEQIELQQSGNRWVLNGGFYASIDPLFSLLQSFKNAEIVEAKTANPDNHAQIELSDDDLKVEFFSDQGSDAFHVGKKTASGLTFLRLEGEDQTYTVKALDAIVFNQDNWQLKTVLDISDEQIQSILISTAEGSEVDVSRNSEDGNFEINNLAEGFQLKADASLNQLANGLSRLMIDAAVPLDVVEEELKVDAKYQLVNGQEIIIKVHQKEDGHFLVIESDQYPEYAAWMMKIADYKFNAFNRSLSEFIEPVDASPIDEKSEDASIE